MRLSRWRLLVDDPLRLAGVDVAQNLARRVARSGRGGVQAAGLVVGAPARSPEACAARSDGMPAACRPIPPQLGSTALRESIAGRDTVIMGTNELIGIDPAALKPVIERLVGQWQTQSIPASADRWSEKRIVELLDRPLGR
jgi:hypothetical protein